MPNKKIEVEIRSFISKQKLDELKIPLTSKENFENKFKHYKENWRNLIENAMD